MKGVINIKDLRAIANVVNDHDISEEELEHMIKVCDPNGNGKSISWDAFLQFNSREEYIV